eukprot:s924_g1.t1
MDQVTNAVNDELISSLDYKMRTSNASYVIARKDIQFYPSSLSTFTPTTSRVARIPLTTGGHFQEILMAPTLVGLLNCGKMLPPQLNLVLEIEWADPADVVRGGTNSSVDYDIQNVRVLASQVTLDSALVESFNRVLLSGGDWLDPDSIKIAFRFVNNDATNDFHPIMGHPACLIKRIQLFANGQRTDDVDNYARSVHLYSLLKPKEWWINQAN